MDISIAGVEDVDDADVVSATDFRDPPENMRELRARHHAILRAVTWAQAADRAEGLFASLP